MGAVDVVIDAVVLDEDLGFEERVELPEVDEFLAEAGVERFDPGVLQGDPGSMNTESTTIASASLVYS